MSYKQKIMALVLLVVGFFNDQLHVLNHLAAHASESDTLVAKPGGKRGHGGATCE